MILPPMKFRNVWAITEYSTDRRTDGTNFFFVELLARRKPELPREYLVIVVSGDGRYVSDPINV